MLFLDLSLFNILLIIINCFHYRTLIIRTSCSYKDIFNLFPDLTLLNTFIINKKHPLCEHIFQAEGLPVAFRLRKLRSEKANVI